MFKKFMLPVLALGLFSFAGCGSSDGGKPVDDAEAKKAADAAEKKGGERRGAPLLKM